VFTGYTAVRAIILARGFRNIDITARSVQSTHIALWIVTQLRSIRSKLPRGAVHTVKLDTQLLINYVPTS